MIAPIANITNDDPAATAGDGFSLGFTPSSCVTWISTARSVSAWTSAAAAVAVCALMPIEVKVSTSSASSASGCVRSARRSTRTSASICSLDVLTEVYSPSAIENAPATRPATPLRTTVCAATPAPPTPAISDVLVTSPSIAPNTAARSQPPETSEWVWSKSCGMEAMSGVAAFTNQNLAGKTSLI
ncbi:hypothetical protein GCM10027068_04290 [Prescottella soli]